MKTLVLGYGLLGKEICKITGWDYVNREEGFDITNVMNWNSIMGPYERIVNCVANTDTYSNDKESHWLTNYKGVADLVKYCNNKSKFLVHVSTDYVYAGSDNFANEDSTVPMHAKNWYSYTKLLSDGYVQLESNNYLLIRCSHKPNVATYEKAWIDQVGNFDAVYEIASLIIKLMNKNVRGVYNVGTELKSMYSLATKSNKSILPTVSPEYVPKNVSMDLTKMKKTIES